MAEKTTRTRGAEPPPQPARSEQEEQLVQTVTAYLEDSRFSRLLIKSLTAVALIYTGVAVVATLIDATDNLLPTVLGLIAK